MDSIHGDYPGDDDDDSSSGGSSGGSYDDEDDDWTPPPPTPEQEHEQFNQIATAKPATFVKAENVGNKVTAKNITTYTKAIVNPDYYDPKLNNYETRKPSETIKETTKKLLKTTNTVLSVTAGITSGIAFGLALASIAPITVGILGSISIGASLGSLAITGIQYSRGDISRKDALISSAITIPSIGFGIAGGAVRNLTKIGSTLKEGFSGYSFIAGRTWSIAGAFYALGSNTDESEGVLHAIE
ncbi:MAG: hypothetical protein ACOYVD_17270 [Bacillota bacterium]